MDEVSNITVAMEKDSHVPADEELVVATLAGEDVAFAELVRRYKRTVARIAGRFFPRQEQIEEMIQVTFCRAYRALPQFRGSRQKSFPAWLSSITANVCLDELRRRQRRQEHFFSALSEAETFKLQQATTIASSEQALISRDLAHYLLSHLTPEDRLTLSLLYEEEWTMAEIANLLDWSVAKVKGRAYQARQTLQRVREQMQ
jgi:RNA polymerase sigma-70 factor, ECF subfamily